MIALEALLVEPAAQAGIKIPPNIDHYEADEFPHFMVYTTAQIGQPLPHWNAHWENAHVVAAIPEERIRNVSMADLVAEGFQVGFKIP